MKNRIIYILTLIILFNISYLYPIKTEAAEKETYTIISIDGMQNELTKEYMDSGILPNFKNIRDNGLFATDIRSVTPSLTIASHAAMATGALPNKTGMVSNNLHNKEKGFTDIKSAFFSPLHASPIWYEATKQGKTTATVLFPTSNPQFEQHATYAVYFGTTWADSALESIHFSKAKYWENAPKSFSLPQESMFTIKLEDKKVKRTEKIYVLAIDSSNNQKIDYDTFYLAKERVINKDTTQSNKDNWGNHLVGLDKSQTPIGFSFKFKDINPDLSGASLYRTAITSGLVKGPDTFKEDINQKFGFQPVEEDASALEKKWITREEYEDISENFAKWTTDVSLHIKNTYKPDLLFYYYPQVDFEEHAYFLTDPRQPGYSEEKAKTYMGHVKWAYKLVDKEIGRMHAQKANNETTFLISDHGMEPVHTMISPNEVLAKAGLLKKNGKGEISSKESQAYTIASGETAQVYINLKGREKDGIVDPADYDLVQQEIIHAFQQLKIPIKEIPQITPSVDNSNIIEKLPLYLSTKKTVDNNAFSKMKAVRTENPFESVLLTEDKRLESINHSRAGDVFLTAKEGYYISQDEKRIAATPDDLGEHGGNSERLALRPILFVGGNSYTEGEISEKISTVDLAPTLYALMQLKAPEFMDGKAIPTVVQASKSSSK